MGPVLEDGTVGADPKGSKAVQEGKGTTSKKENRKKK